MHQLKMKPFMLVIIVTLAIIGLVTSYSGYYTERQIVAVTQTKFLSTTWTVTITLHGIHW
ncbi:MAG TPA: hypothetical protein VK503_04705 [Candidatus Bathyarchaeia archaeon]|nr:hypothetical protein [Candidatus Bathyarchaeia archaeon]